MRRIGAGQRLVVRDPALVTADRGGRIYILDEANHSILVLDSLGTLIRSLGRRGDGPGEFQFPVALQLESDGTLAVVDLANAVLVRFDSSGRSVAERPFAGLGPPLRRIRFSADAVRLDEGRLVSGQPTQRLLLVQNADTTILASTAQETKGEARFGCGPTLRGIPFVFAPSLSWSSMDSLTAVTDQVQYEVRVWWGRL